MAIVRQNGVFLKFMVCLIAAFQSVVFASRLPKGKDAKTQFAVECESSLTPNTTVNSADRVAADWNIKDMPIAEDLSESGRTTALETIGRRTKNIEKFDASAFVESVVFAKNRDSVRSPSDLAQILNDVKLDNSIKNSSGTMESVYSMLTDSISNYPARNLKEQFIVYNALAHFLDQTTNLINVRHQYILRLPLNSWESFPDTTSPDILPDATIVSQSAYFDLTMLALMAPYWANIPQEGSDYDMFFILFLRTWFPDFANIKTKNIVLNAMAKAITDYIEPDSTRSPEDPWKAHIIAARTINAYNIWESHK